MLSSLSKRYLGQDYTNKKPAGGSVTAGMIDSVSDLSLTQSAQWTLSHCEASMIKKYGIPV